MIMPYCVCHSSTHACRFSIFSAWAAGVKMTKFSPLVMTLELRRLLKSTFPGVIHGGVVDTIPKSDW